MASYAAKLEGHQRERDFEVLTNSSIQNRLWLGAYTYGRTTFIEVLLDRQGTKLEYSELYTPNPLANIKQVNHSVMAMVLNKIVDRPLHVFYTLTGLDNKNIATQENIYYTAIPLEDNPVQQRLKKRITEVRQ